MVKSRYETERNVVMDEGMARRMLMGILPPLYISSYCPCAGSQHHPINTIL
jgi:hypothetical protein